ncbi:hypothetical protein [Nostoc parmelioides]|uniref:Uncharacterized protein n=1 Tax=Nostoc parmelioides FACHB-3921 TaxID=2692909 RepID=A0ABR8BNW8_9NOSO|nr:hypothetical protein [Nostoc parmelioides]MBD2255648.1 hypothetical protein [Nostoc parmelioides FACHB-3921]
MTIDLDWLNRIGIILNFLAGFMLAPNVLGTKMLEKFEEVIDDFSNSLNSKIQKKFKRFLNSGTIQGNTAKITAYLFILFMWFFLTLLVIVLPFLETENLLQVIGRIVFIFCIITFTLSLTYLSIPTVLSDIVKALDELTKQPDSSIRVLGFWGIIFFIIGNLFQFIASFK